MKASKLAVISSQIHNSGTAHLNMPYRRFTSGPGSGKMSTIQRADCSIDAEVALACWSY
jgi:hypothetical protein